MDNIFSSGVEKAIWYVIVPMLFVMIVFSVFVFFYNLKNREERPNETSYFVNFLTDLIGIVFGAVLLGISIGFSLAFIKTMRDYDVVSRNQTFYYILLFFPLLPFSFLLIYIRKFLLNLNKKDLVLKERKDARYGARKEI